MKKSYKIFLTIISVLLLPGLITGCKKLDYNGDENNYNVYLYGKWDNDISVLKMKILLFRFLFMILIIKLMMIHL